MKLKFTFKSHIVTPLRKAALELSRRLGEYEETVWLIGDGRSGTTWVSDLINHGRRYREMFEPFHPMAIDAMRFLRPHQYMRPDERHEQFEKVAADVFSGRFMHPRVDAASRAFFCRKLLIKDIFANLFAYWASRRFPELKIVLLIRNPFAVALSKSRKKDWLWVDDPMILLQQQALFEDYLQPFEDLIAETAGNGDYILRQILIWSILHHVPLRQFGENRLHIVFYEEMFADPNRELSSLLAFLSDQEESPAVELDKRTIGRLSRFSGRESTLATGKSPVTSWKSELSSRQIDAGLTILHAFGLDGLYDENSMPCRSSLFDLQGAEDCL